MAQTLAKAATAFEQTLHDLGFSGTEEELGGVAALGQRAALLAVSSLIWRRHLGPLLDTKQVQLLLGGRTRQAVSDLVKRGRLLAIPDENGHLFFPSFQFSSNGRPFAILPAVLEVFAPAAISAHTLASWFVTPQRLLNDQTPVHWLQSGGDTTMVLEAARRGAARLGQ